MKIDTVKLQLAMAKAQMTVAEVRKEASIPVGTWSHVRRGNNATPKTIGKIARALGVPVESLLADEQE